MQNRLSQILDQFIESTAVPPEVASSISCISNNHFISFLGQLHICYHIWMSYVLEHLVSSIFAFIDQQVEPNTITNYFCLPNHKKIVAGRAPWKCVLQLKSDLIVPIDLYSITPI